MASMPTIDIVAMAAALTDPEQRVAFAAMVLSCDRAAHNARMGYDTGGGIRYITAAGVAKDTGLSVASAVRALRALESAGLAVADSEGRAWRTDTENLDMLTLATKTPPGC